MWLSVVLAVVDNSFRVTKKRSDNIWTRHLTQIFKALGFVEKVVNVSHRAILARLRREFIEQIIVNVIR